VHTSAVIERRAITVYSHTQRGTVTILAIGVGSVLVLILSFAPGVRAAPGARAALWITFAVMLLSALLLASMTITVGEGVLEWHFGLGVFGKAVSLEDIASAEPTSLSILSGWGIHLTLRGWLYNVSGRGAVLVTMRNGKRFLLGSDEPDRLAAAINVARGRASL
jgi:hypothetical protein